MFREDNMVNPQTTLNFADAAKISNQCWVQDPVGKWIVHTGLDTVAMEGFIKDRWHWPAIPITHPKELGYDGI